MNVCFPFSPLLSQTNCIVKSFVLKHLPPTAGVRAFDGLVLAAARCQVADLLESILSSTTPILRLDFMPCPPAVLGLKAERLELYRLDASSLFFLSLAFVITQISLIAAMNILRTPAEITAAATHSTSGWNTTSALRPLITTHVCCWTRRRSSKRFSSFPFLSAILHSTYSHSVI